MSDPVCSACQQPLVVEIQPDDDDISHDAGPQNVPDDTELACGCHFHWECLLDLYQVETCPACNRHITSSTDNGTQQLLCDMRNEGGFQRGLDILPLLKEEQYLRAYPEERRARAFLEYCRAADVRALVEMLQDNQEDEDEDEDDEGNGDSKKPETARTPHAVDMLTYQDPIGDMQSGLHAAVLANSREVAWLLLLLASDLDFSQFPVQVFQEAEQVGIMRDERRSGNVDIRTLRDAEGRTAEDLARDIGGIWAADGWIGSGRLAL